VKTITSADNVSFKRWRRLAESPREVGRSRRTLAEGTHLARAVCEDGHPVEAVLARRGVTARDSLHWVEHYSQAGAAVFELAPGLFDQVSPVERSAGLVLVLPIGPARPLCGGDALYLDGVQDPGNAGALLRVAAAAGVRNVLSAPASVALWSPKVLRGGQGAHFVLAIHEDIDGARLQEIHPATWIATDPHAGETLWSAGLEEAAIGWVVGSEGAGLSLAAAAACCRRIRIPLAEGTESLNVAAAAAVCLFERRRRAFVSQAGTSAPA